MSSAAKVKTLNIRRDIAAEDRFLTSFKAEQTAIRAELDKHENPKDRLRVILKGISEGSRAESATEYIRRYIFVMFAILHHRHHGGLSRRQLQELKKIATAILRILRADQKGARIGWLLGELYQAFSNVYRITGAHIRSLWYDRLAPHFGSRESVHVGTDLLGLGIRFLRLGHARIAMSYWQAAQTEGLSERQTAASILGQLKALRLCNDLPLAEAYAHGVGKNATMNVDENREVEWEALSRELTKSLNLQPLLVATSARGNHHESVYILETFLWAYALRSTQWQEKVFSTRVIANKPELRAHRVGHLYKIAQTLENCYDTALPLTRRLERIGNVLVDAKALLAVEHELLVWAAAARWLARIRERDLATLALAEYTGLGLRLSDGTCADVLGTTQDLIDSSWFKESKQSPTEQAPISSRASRSAAG